MSALGVELDFRKQRAASRQIQPSGRFLAQRFRKSVPNARDPCFQLDEIEPLRHKPRLNTHVVCRGDLSAIENCFEENCYVSPLPNYRQGRADWQ